jgi:hypothetical protein
VTVNPKTPSLIGQKLGTGPWIGAGGHATKSKDQAHAQIVHAPESEMRACLEVYGWAIDRGLAQCFADPARELGPQLLPFKQRPH